MYNDFNFLLLSLIHFQDGRLRTGDYILRIGETHTRGLASEQVVQVLQSCGSHVRMLIARDPLEEAQPPPPPAPATAPITSLPPPPPMPARRGSKTVQNTPALKLFSDWLIDCYYDD